MSGELTRLHKPSQTQSDSVGNYSDEVLLCGLVGMCDLWLHAKML
jgi:hypothetical protein